MFEILEKFILAGVGFATLTKEKAEKIIDALIAKGQIKAKDKKAMLSRLLKHTQQLDKDIESKMRQVSLNVVKGSQKQIDALHKKLAQLTKDIKNTQQKNNKKSKTNY
ncbi:MAG: hypothetical protein V1747_07350 [Candidatus Omnitrophota bacterium]